MAIGEKARRALGVLDDIERRRMYRASDALELDQHIVVLAARQRGDLLLRRQGHLHRCWHAANSTEGV